MLYLINICNFITGINDCFNNFLIYWAAPIFVILTKSFGSWWKLDKHCVYVSVSGSRLIKHHISESVCQSVSVNLAAGHIWRLCHSLNEIKRHPIQPTSFCFTTSVLPCCLLPKTPVLRFFPKQRVSDTCNIPAAAVSEGNQKQDLSLLTLSVACPFFPVKLLLQDCYLLHR